MYAWYHKFISTNCTNPESLVMLVTSNMLPWHVNSATYRFYHGVRHEQLIFCLIKTHQCNLSTQYVHNPGEHFSSEQNCRIIFWDRSPDLLTHQLFRVTVIALDTRYYIWTINHQNMFNIGNFCVIRDKKNVGFFFPPLLHFATKDPTLSRGSTCTVKMVAVSIEATSTGPSSSVYSPEQCEQFLSNRPSAWSLLTIFL